MSAVKGVRRTPRHRAARYSVSIRGRTSAEGIAAAWESVLIKAGAPTNAPLKPVAVPAVKPSPLTDPSAILAAQEALQAAIAYPPNPWALRQIGMPDVRTAIAVLQTLTVAQHQDADDVPNVNLLEHYRFAVGGLANRVLANLAYLPVETSDPTDKETPAP